VQYWKATSVSTLIFGNSQVRLNLGYQDNDRREFSESAENPSLFMHLSTITYDAKFTHLFENKTELVAGLSGMTQMNENKGEEYLIPEYHLQTGGGFIYVKKSLKLFTLNAGVRLDFRSMTGASLYLDSLGQPATSGDTIFPGFTSANSAFSGSSGFTFSPSKVYNFKFNIGSGFRAPNIAELGSNGVHEGTFRYEIGNPGSKPENSLQVDGEISFNLKWISATFNGYYNYIFNYIYQRNVNDEKVFYQDQWYPVYRFVQGNSVLKGFEFELDFHPVDQLHFENSLDYVMGSNVSVGTPLPLIPPLHSIHELKWIFTTSKRSIFHGPYISVSAEINYAQNRVDTFETPTPGYFLLNAAMGSQLRVQNQTWTFFISGKNLTNTKYFDHLSRLKEIGIYNMGMNITFGVVIPFGLYSK
jgi:iron complex outermembrane recepter protein